MALLAFPNLAHEDAPDDSAYGPITQLMKRTQRIKVATELNAAILESQGQGMEPKLGGLVRLMMWGDERLCKAGVGVSDDRGKQWPDVVLGEL